jgi:hypothetical protein
LSRVLCIRLPFQKSLISLLVLFLILFDFKFLTFFFFFLFSDTFSSKTYCQLKSEMSYIDDFLYKGGDPAFKLIEGIEEYIFVSLIAVVGSMQEERGLVCEIP